VTVSEQSFRLLLTLLSQHVHLCPGVSIVPMGVCSLRLLAERFHVVNDYVHFGHHISANLDDKSDILRTRKSKSGKKITCYVSFRIVIHFCCDFYGCTLWDLAHSSINECA